MTSLDRLEVNLVRVAYILMIQKFGLITRPDFCAQLRSRGAESNRNYPSAFPRSRCLAHFTP